MCALPLNASLVTIEKGKAAPAPDPAAVPEPEWIGITTRLTPDVHEQLRRLAFERREPMGKVIERAVVAYLDQRTE
jgi:predicted transcriptional regulator